MALSASRSSLLARLEIEGPKRRWWTLGAVSFSLFMIMLDNTIVNVALPSIGRGLAIGVSQLEWVVNAYTSRSRCCF